MQNHRTDISGQKSRPGRPGPPAEVMAAVAEALDEGHDTPAAMLAALSRRWPGGLPGYEGALPDQRTVRRWIARVATGDDSGPWALTPEANPDDACAVLDVLHAVIERTEGRVTSFSTREAAWIAIIARTVPVMTPWGAYITARSYIRREARGEPVDDLDAMLGFLRTGDDDGYQRALDAGWLREPPIRGMAGDDLAKTWAIILALRDLVRQCESRPGLAAAMAEVAGALPELKAAVAEVADVFHWTNKALFDASGPAPPGGG